MQIKALPKLPSFIFSTLLFVATACLLFACQKIAPEPKHGFSLEGISIDSLQSELASGKITSLQLTQLYLERIAAIDQSGPALHAIIELNPDALEIAAAMDQERVHHHIRSPLHGIPIVIKDNINTCDDMHTTAGSLALAGNKASQDAFIIHQLRMAGAIILGKTNLSEWANFRSKQSISGWSSRGGQTKNPYVLGSSPCGSSTGSAVAVSADLCVVAIGTSTDGSIACPASMNGVVGIRPTIGLVSRSGVIPISKTQDTPGALGRSVKDATILLNAIIGIDPNDEITLTSIGKASKDYTKLFNLKALQGKRIGVDKTMLKENDEVGNLLRRALEQMKEKGAVIIEVSFVDKYQSISMYEAEMLKYEFNDGVNRYLSTVAGPIKSIADVIRFNNENKETVMPFFNQDLIVDAASKGSLESESYKTAIAQLRTMRAYLDDLIASNHLDALVGVGYGAYSSAAVAGYPSVTVPMGFIKEVPYGLTFFSHAFSEQRLLAIAYAYEQVSKNRTSPKYLSIP